MYCKHCGKVIDDDSMVCIYCGQKVGSGAANGENTGVPPVAAQQPTLPIFPKAEEPKKSNTAMLTVIIFMTGLILALVLTIVVIVLMSNSGPEKGNDSPGASQSLDADGQTDRDIGLPADNIYYDVFVQYETYVLQGSNNTYKCYSDIVNMTDEELTIAEEEIHARHGKKFSDEDLQAYFEARSWYTPGSGSYTPSHHEQANLDLIRVYREKQDGSLYRSGNGYINAFSKTVDYALPNSSSRKLDGYDIDHLTEVQLCVARNEILARHGWIFDDQLLREYFYSKEWYKPSIPGKQFDYSVLSSIEQSNISLIQVYEKKAEGISWSSDNPYKAVFYAYSGQDYIFYNSSSRYLTDSDLVGMTEDELCIARNEIYARNGYTFKSQNLTEYFSHHDWYFPRTAPGVNPSFSAVENANIELINKAEKAAAKNSNKIYNGSTGVNLSSLDTTLNYTVSCDIFSVKLPNYWKQYANVEKDENGFDFCDKLSQDKGYPGWLFSIEIWNYDYDYTDMPRYQYLGKMTSPDGETYDLISTGPTDADFWIEIAQLHNKMDAESSRIYPTIKAINGWTFTPA